MTRTRINRKQSSSQSSHEKSMPSNSARTVQSDHTEGTPVSGETYRCGGCGMELEITADCGCENADHVRLECCGAEMDRV